MCCFPHPPKDPRPVDGDPRTPRTNGVLRAMVTCTPPCWAAARQGCPDGRPPGMPGDAVLGWYTLGKSMGNLWEIYGKDGGSY